MQQVLMLVLSLHILSTIFWAGSTFTLARLGGTGAERLFRPQMIAATVAILSGGTMGHLVHSGALGRGELLLVAGALCSVLALLVQGFLVGPILKRLQPDNPDEAIARSRATRAHRMAAVLLALAAVLMATARYA
ncbi:hypothetical protein [Dyella koreensis]|uniref:DUF2269 family protein n=1 Tax=Dyella koreensis TaxID=311235 RepID=A0ABW8K761_9GAMM